MKLLDVIGLHSIKARTKIYFFTSNNKKANKKSSKTKLKIKMFVSSLYGYGLAAPAWGYSSWGYAPAWGYRSAYGLW